MKVRDVNWGLLKMIASFFPLHLVISHLKYNLISLLIWILLGLIITDNLGSNFGIPYLFLSPEYLGSVSSLSFMLLGFALGGFIMGFNTYSYMKVGAHYPFLSTLSRPFYKFCINNSLIPLAFFIIHSIQIWNFQLQQELVDSSTVLFFIASYFSGILIFMLLSSIYFFPMSKRSTRFNAHSQRPFHSMILRRSNWYSIYAAEKDRQYIYIGSNYKFIASRSTEHFDEELYERVFAKNLINASIYEILTISIFFTLGLFNDFKIFEVPAGASIILLFTIFLMLFSALHSWLREWTYPLLIFIIVVMNTLSLHTSFFDYSSFAYGLNYQKPIDYSLENIKNKHSIELRKKSKADYIQTLEAWKKSTGLEKPKLIIVNTSGGGSRSSLWTVAVLQELDELSNGKITAQTQMITGASGGMIGAAYFRSILLESKLHPEKKINIQDSTYRVNMGKDILNRMSFIASTNDIFIRFRKHSVNGRSYTIDRGYGFEQQLNENTNGILDKSLGHFLPYEKNGSIPTMIFSPTIVNDGRRMLISSQNLSFLQSQNHAERAGTPMYENVDFNSFFGQQAIEDVRFTSVLRSSATFPFVMPMMTMPTKPEILLMDAGIRDNYGTKNTLIFLDELSDWISKNTSGVVLIQIRDTKKVMQNEEIDPVSLASKISLPFGNMYKNFPRVQTFDQEEMLHYAGGQFPFRMDVFTFNLMENRKERIALSWHLTQREKSKINDALRTNSNSKSLQTLLDLTK